MQHRHLLLVLGESCAGAAEVVLLDREPLALQCALLNAALNGLPTTTASPPAAAAGSAAAAPGATAGSMGSGASSGVQALSLQQLLPHLQAADAEQVVEQQRLLEEQRQAQAEAASASGGRNGGSAGGSSRGVVRAEVFDWSQPVAISPHHVMLVCDCLYEAFSVQVCTAAAAAGAASL